MSSPFKVLDQLAQQAVTDLDGEFFSFKPKQAVINGFQSPASDSSREHVSVKGILSVVPAETEVKGSRRQSEISGSSRYSLSDIELWISFSEFSKLDFKVEAGDVIQQIECCKSFEVLRVKPTEQGDVYFELIEAFD